MKEILEYLGKYAVLLPIIHVIACSIFFAGYIMAFGDNVSALFSFTDLFEMSFSGLITIYGAGLLLPASILALKRSSPLHWPTGPLTTADQTRMRSGWKITTVILVSFAVFSTILSIHRHIMVPYVIWVVALSACIAQPSADFLNKHGVNDLTNDVIWLALSFSMMAFVAGYTGGSMDRFTPFKSMIGQRVGCNDLVIVKKVSSSYIAVRRDNRRIVVDDKCNTQFEFPVRAVYSGY